MADAITAPAGALRRGGQRPLALLVTAALVAAAIILGAEEWRRGALLLVGGALGATLYVGAFGFAAAYRRLFAARDGAGVAAQVVMLAVATLLFAPLLVQGTAWGLPLAGAVAPAGVQVAIGALLFGVGMQLGGACASGCLYAAGGGSPRVAVTLVAFCAGTFLGSLHMHLWAGLPTWGAISLGDALGWGLALPLQLGVLGLALLVLKAWSRTPVLDLRAGRPLLVAALLLAGLNALTLVLAGHPWTITWAFALWGAKAALALGWDPATSPFWSGGFPQAALAAGVLEDTTSVMNIGILAGALAAAAWRGRFRPSWRLPPRALLAAVVGGLAMGYGARLAYGCNIGAFFSGVASTSLHGWLWIAAALLGTWIGLRLRPVFGLSRN